MKRILLLIYFIAVNYTLNAQQCDETLPITETFDDANVIDVCWNLIDADGDGKNWYWRDYGISNGGYKCLTSRSFSSSSGNLDPDNWIISHVIDLTTFNTNDNIYINYKVRAEHPSFAHEFYTVYASPGNQISDFESSPVSRGEFADEVGASGAFVNRSLDISSLAGNMIYIAFRHENIAGSQFILNIDDVVISNSLLNNEEFIDFDFKHYYNKDSSTLIIENNHNLENIQIYNLLGKRVLNKPLVQSKEYIDLSSLNRGVYVVKVKNDISSKTFKVMKY
ncbi:T9SS-dependent choice-of-anchor J family protein [Aestuariivivens sediminicola]|uniref:T9SS-dependent choice-of-anchor J family protein n=1 Tax=Aestuariivivens sediminicola TaxID=2913560 RepID=UPI001F5AF535|nr:choice-of-anchor J domain-containing protein [Aestuariivivens sediminicola]